MKKYNKPQITVTRIRPVSLLMESLASSGPTAVVKNPGFRPSSSRATLWDEDDFDDE